MPKRVEVEHREHVGHAQWSGGVTGSRLHEHLDDRLTNFVRGLLEGEFFVGREEHLISPEAVERMRLIGCWFCDLRAERSPALLVSVCFL